MNGAVYPLKYDIVKDFEPVSLLVKESAMIVGRQDLPAKNLVELIAWLKANPDKALAGTGGVGTVSDVALVFFERQIGAKVQVIPYRGLGPAIQALIAKEVDFVMSLPANALPQVRAGTIKAFAVAAKTRFVGAPEIPTVDEAGLKGSTSRTGMRFSCPRARRPPLSTNSTPPQETALADPGVRKIRRLGQDFGGADDACGTRRRSERRNRAALASHQGSRHQAVAKQHAPRRYPIFHLERRSNK